MPGNYAFRTFLKDIVFAILLLINLVTLFKRKHLTLFFAGDFVGGIAVVAFPPGVSVGAIVVVPLPPGVSVGSIVVVSFPPDTSSST